MLRRKFIALSTNIRKKEYIKSITYASTLENYRRKHKLSLKQEDKKLLKLKQKSLKLKAGKQ